MCREPIDPLAKLCKTCKSDITWRRHLSVGNTTLALLVALFSVLGTVAPALKSLFAPRPKIQVALIRPGGDGKEVAVFVNNSTARAFAITDVTAHVTNGLSRKSLIRMTFEPSSAASAVVPAGKTNAVSLTLKNFELTRDAARSFQSGDYSIERLRSLLAGGTVMDLDESKSNCALVWRGTLDSGEDFVGYPPYECRYLVQAGSNWAIEHDPQYRLQIEALLHPGEAAK
jgi:hypothetical protein